MRCLLLQPFALMKLRPLRIKYASLTPVFFLITIDPFGSSRDIDHIYTRASTHVEAKWATRNTHTHMLHGRGSIWKANSLCGQNPWMSVNLFFCPSINHCIIFLYLLYVARWRCSFSHTTNEWLLQQPINQSIKSVLSICPICQAEYLSLLFFKF